MRVAAFAAAPALNGCSIDGDEAVTLYRNSPDDHSFRIHVGTFDTDNGVDYNFSNCRLAARLLNANVAALAERNGQPRNPRLGFWCEIGPFKKKGGPPVSFNEEFPTIAA